MPLAQYTATLFFPGGNRAVGASVVVSIQASNQVPLLFADAAGTIPVPVTMTADGAGMITFYAAPGYYLANLAESLFPIPLDPGFSTATWPNTYIHVQTVPALMWTVDHFFGVVPSVDLVMSGNQVEAEIDHPSVTQTIITFTTAQTGAAYLRR
jgi:hypothetical protein